MLEMMMGGSGRVYPWSGPGNKKLKFGTRDLGYFGEVTQAELFGNDEVWGMVKPVTGTKNNAALNVWLKFILDGRVLYTPKYPITMGTKWEDLYAAGAVYGVKGNGDAPVPAGGAVDQFRMVTKIEKIVGVNKIWPLKLQLMSGANSLINSTNDWASDRSEWDRLWTPFFAQKWETYGWQEMNQGYTNRLATIKERNGDGTNYGTRGGNNTIALKNYIAMNTTSSSISWRPVLELINDPNMALSPYLPYFAVSGGQKNFFPVFGDDGVAPLKGVGNVRGYNSHQLGVMFGFDTKTEQVWLEPSTGKQVLTADFTDTSELVPLRNMTLRNSAMTPQAVNVQTGREEVFVNVPQATVTLTAAVETVDAGLISPQRVVAIRTAQQPILDYTVKGYEGSVDFSNSAKQNAPTPTFTIEADGT
ncbi:hypothetical protein [Erwinia phage vB_Ea277G]|nr:hypothetical protein [Erwinia phage vB_Ea277G]